MKRGHARSKRYRGYGKRAGASRSSENGENGDDGGSGVQHEGTKLTETNEGRLLGSSVVSTARPAGDDRFAVGGLRPAHAGGRESSFSPFVLVHFVPSC